MTQEGSSTDPPLSQCPEPIAIVGIGCRWPGGVRNPSQLWDLLKEERDGFAEFAIDRINTNGFYHPSGQRLGTMYTKGGFLLNENTRDFDHTFFGMSATEAMALDPSQRKLLEVTYEAVESAGIPLEKFSGTKTGVFVGNFNNEHQTMQLRDPDHTLPYVVTGGGPTILSNRINYVFNLQGPSLMVDTACSASMYALHLAVLAIRNGDCSGAIVAGANVILGPDNQIFTTKLGAVSPTSRCHTFDASADGYARAEGFGAFYLKKLSDALADGDPIRALIRGTSFNANGRTGGISHPSPDGQEAVMRQAYKNAGNLNPDLTGYMECHGTGTPVGDPIEVSAVGRVFSPGRTKDPLLIGSIKPNVGHSEAASAMSQMMKGILAMEHGQIPATIGIKKFNPAIDFETAKAKVVTEMTPWPAHLLRRVSINSFGYGGANAHCILDHPSVILQGYQLQGFPRSYLTSIPRPLRSADINANGYANGHSNGYTNGNATGTSYTPTFRWCTPVKVSPMPPVGTRPFVLFPMSGHDDRALKSIVSGVSASLKDYNLANVLYTLSQRRSNFSRRSFAIAEPEELSTGLDSIKLTYGKAPSAAAKRIGFVFTGQGAQWPQMGHQLLHEYTVFRETIKYLDYVLSRLQQKPDWTIEKALLEPSVTSRINEPAFSQTVCTGLQIALLALLRQWGINPVATVGHSSGEIAAAYAAGRLKASEAIVLAYFRGKVVATNKKQGLMLAVGLGPDEARPYLGGIENKVKIAAVNSPNSVTLSGESDAIQALNQKLADEGVFARLLKTGGNAYHSHHMQALGTPYEEQATEGLEDVKALTETERSMPLLKWVSSVATDKQIESPLPDYWRQNLESPVLFSPAVEKLAREEPLDLLIEIGPHPALGGPLKQIRANLEKTGIVLASCLGSLRRGEHDVVSMLTLAGNLYLNNAPVDLASVNAAEIKSKVDGTVVLRHGFQCLDMFQYPYSYPDVPNYFENRFNKEYRTRNHLRHDLLGSRVPAGSKKHPQWRNVLRMKDLPWLDDHKLIPHAVLPGAAYIAMAVEAASQLHQDEAELAGVLDKPKGFKLRQVSIISTLNVEDTELGIETVLNMQKVALTNAALTSEWYSFSIGSIAPNSDVWTEHCTGTICAVMGESSISEDEKLKLDPRARTLQIGRWHQKFASAGLGYGPAFQGLSDLQAYRSSNTAAANVALKPTDMKAESVYPIHPATLDTCIQLALIACHAGQVENLEKAFVPVFADNVTIWHAKDGNAKQAWGVATGDPIGLRSVSARVQLYDQELPLLDIGELKCVTYDGAPNDDGSELAREPYWRPVARIDSDTLTTRTAQTLFPPENPSSSVVWTLNTLAAHVVASIEGQLRSADLQQDKTQNHDKFAAWIKAWVASSTHKGVLGVTSKADRLSIIEKLATQLHSNPEAQCLKILHDNIGRVLSGDTNSLKVLIESNLLTKLFSSGLSVTGGYSQLKRLVDLLAHKNPRMRILEVGGGTAGATTAILETLAASSTFKRFEQYVFSDAAGWCVSDAKTTFGEHSSGLAFQTFDVQVDPVSQGFETNSFDLIIASDSLIELGDLSGGLGNLHSLLKPSGSLLIKETVRSALGPEVLTRTLTGKWNQEEIFSSVEHWNRLLLSSGFSGVDVSLDDVSFDPLPFGYLDKPCEIGPLRTDRIVKYAHGQELSSVILARARDSASSAPTVAQAEHVYIVSRDEHRPLLAERLAATLAQDGKKATFIDLSTCQDIPPDAPVVSLVDLNGSTVNSRNGTYFTALQTLVSRASKMVWVASDLRSPAESSIMKGLLRSISAENVLSKYCFVEIDHGHHTSQARTADLILGKLDDLYAASSSSDAGHEAEAVIRGGFLHIERLLPEEWLNEEYRKRHDRRQQRLETSDVQACPIGDQGPLTARYSQPGLLSSLYFTQDATFSEPLASDWIEIKTSAIGLNMKDLAVATARFDLNKLSTEGSGVVTRVGSTVTCFKPGDRVFGMIPGNMGNYLRSPAALVSKIPDALPTEVAASMPVVFLTSIYALIHLAHLGKGDSILIQSATGGLGMAAIQVAQHLGAEIFATVGNDAKRDILAKDFGICPSHIFNSRKMESIDEIMKATQQKGIDVILSAAGGDMMHEMWRCIAPLGRFIDVGRTDVLGGGKLGLDVFKRNASFSSFDMGLIYRQKPAMIERLMGEMNKLIADGIIGPIPRLTSFDISRLETAMSYFSKGQHTGKLVITFNDPKAPLRILRPAIRASFDSNAAYLLVGCLGGLGRSLAAWMVERGARNLIFFSRSGTKKPEAAATIRELTETGAKCQVFECDVTNQKALRLAVEQVASQMPVRGVIHAAMVEGDAFFSNTSLSQIQSVLAPKVAGTISLHEATKSLPLDFFLMTSSIIGSVGTPSQGAYTAANAFQDAFARYRISQSLPATALGLGLILEVGSVSNSLSFQKMLERNATYGISETEFLQLFEGALCESKLPGQNSTLSELDPSCCGQVVTGLEPAQFIPYLDSGRADDLVWFKNHRFQAVTQATTERAKARNSASSGGSGGAASYRSRIEEASTPEEKLLIAREAVTSRIGELVSLAADDLDVGQAISTYGVDSLVAGELRNWLIKTFGAEISLLKLLNKATKIEDLVKKAAGLDK